MIHTLTKFFRVLLFLSIILFTSKAKALSITAASLGSLPPVLVESSGVDYDDNSHFWSFNDTGGDNKIYKLNDHAALQQTITLTNAQNRNWEDMTHDAGRNFLFIGDFGNNNCDRTNLRIWRIAYPNASTGNSVTADEIKFTYPDQTRFPSPWMNFDVESFFHLNGQLFLFTKADGSAVGYTKMYTLPDAPGTYVATLVDSFYTNDRTTSADISPDGSTVVLISNTHIHLFRNFTGTNFFSGQHTQLNIAGAWTQKEGVTFSSNQEIYMTDENSGSGNHLYYVDLSNWIPASPVINTSVEKISDVSVSVYPIPANQYVNISVKNSNSHNMSFSIFDLTGNVVYNSRIENSLIPFEVRTADLSPGVYFYKVFSDAKEVQTARLIVSH